MSSATIMLCLFIAAAPQPAADCPDTKQGETTADCPWAGIARKLTLSAAQGHDVGPLVDALLPELATQMKRDRKLESLHALWGRSRNHDENSGGIIVEPATLAELAARLGVHFEGEVVHSGVQHTYAYLLSIERTPYGFKRRRWVSGTIGNGLGLPEGLLGPAPSKRLRARRDRAWAAACPPGSALPLRRREASRGPDRERERTQRVGP